VPKTRFPGLVQTLIVGGACVASLFAAVEAVSRWRERTAPHVGDMIVFLGTAPRARAMEVLTASGAHCVLELGALRGGSFIVEAPLLGIDGRFKVHWAGTRTAQGAGDCGSAADLVLDTQQLDILRGASGAVSMTPGSGA